MRSDVASLTLEQRLATLPDLAGLIERRHGVIAGVPSGAVALIAQHLRRHGTRPVIVIAEAAENIYLDSRSLAGEADLGLFPAADTPAFDRVPPSEEVNRRRLLALAHLSQPTAPVIVTSPEALVRPTLPLAALRCEPAQLRRGDHIGRDAVIALLARAGYRRVTAVLAAGEYAVRGGIVDVFSADRARPWRAEWFGDDVDDLRAFDADTQTTVARLDTVTLMPARELDLRGATVARALQRLEALDIGSCRQDVREAWLRDIQTLESGYYDEGMDLFFPYLQDQPPTTLLDHAGDALIVAVGGRERLLRTGRRCLEEANGLLDQEIARAELPQGAASGLLSLEQFETMVGGMAAIELVRESESCDLHLGWQGAPVATAGFSSLLPTLRELMQRGVTPIAATRQQHRVEELLSEHDVSHIDVGELEMTTPLVNGTLHVASGDLSEGFVAESLGLAILTDAELFGSAKRRGSLLRRGARRAESTSQRGARRAASSRAATQAFVLQFSKGDLVVHRDHGIGRFIEMSSVADDDGGQHEYMTLEYADSHRLYVPVEHLDRIDRYIGGADSAPSLSRLGTGEWERTKRRVKERAEQVARELLELYSRRELAPGHAFAPDGSWQQELEDAFAYEETPDQELVIDEIKRDMEASRPMDRVVCGDVGFGKTEMALRAAFKSASEGRQVAMLVPTTVLAQQHFMTITERLRPFPLTVAQLSRFCTDEEIRGTLAGLRAGTVDIVIGTHRLLQRDVAFKNLGLVIVDEEQRFGVLQKERFKELRVGVDVLSLSATPIPRTLHMALAGIRDLSVIQSPPEERQPIKTYVVGREDSLVREVITRELGRGGQVFYVHNRVQTIESEAESIRRLVPEARVGVGHGQMEEGMLAPIMRRFTEGELDVLVATTIIESGLDIPNANTIIINDAHRFGLAQLYQLRGRVGRSGTRAYAYLFYPPARSLTEKADKRLEVIAELQDLGAGFKLAMRDLEIRGAGNLLGEEQHGEIAAVGMEMYNHLLRQAVTSLQGKPITESPVHVTVSLPLPAYLPPGYVTDERLRLRCYQDLAACTSEAELDARGRGLTDRFGPLPESAEALLYSLRVRLLAAAAGATAVDRQRSGIVIQLAAGHGLELESVVRQFRPRLAASPSRLILAQEGDWRELLMQSLRELGRMARARQRAGMAV